MVRHLRKKKTVYLTELKQWARLRSTWIVLITKALTIKNINSKKLLIFPKTLHLLQCLFFGNATKLTNIILEE